jgi:rhodanese-related sulfurtransferase
MRLLYTLLALAALATSANAAEIRSSVAAADLPQNKRTTLGLYLSPADAAAALAADPGILFLDVRDPIEVNFIGHPEPVDAVVPFLIVKLEFNDEKGEYKTAPNANFVANAEAVVAKNGFAKDHPIFLTCRSGDRSASATDALAKAGYTNVWTLVEGFEGDKDKAGKRTVNGWRNAGLPWSYKLSASQAWLPGK